MSLVKRLTLSVAFLLSLMTAGAGSAVAQGKSPLPTVTVERSPSNVDLVNRALNPGASDPNVPLPHPDLSAAASGQPAALTGPQIFGRQEQGGGVLGLRVPLPADRGAAAGNTRYGGAGTGSETTPDVR